MIDQKTAKEIAIMKEGGKILSFVLREVAKVIKPGISTWELNQLANQLVKNKGAEPSFLNYNGYPSSLCVSINEEIVHGIAKKDKIVQNGDLVKIDFGVKYRGLFTDSAITVPVGKISRASKKIMNVTKNSLEKAIKILKPGVQVGDISSVIQNYVESEGLSVVKDLVGHGVGRKVHEDPRVPNYGLPGTGPVLSEGVCIAIEPMVTAGSSGVVLADDGWTYKSADDSMTAHFEKTIAIIKSGHQILT